MPRPLRSSCDRCHSQKLKCPKESGVATCTRCIKAGTPCIFSPAGLSTRRNMLTPVHLDGDLNMNMNMNMNMDMDMQFDWPPLDLRGALGTPPDAIQELQPDTAQRVGPAQAASQDPRSMCIRQLTALVVDVDLVSQDLSSICRVHVPKNRPIEEYHSEFIENSARHLCIEQLFTHAQRLMNVYSQALKLIFDRPDYSECNDPDCFHAVELPDELAVFFSGLDDGQDKIDVLLFNLLTSCHAKVVDVMGLVVLCARTCTQITLISPDLVEPDVRIPEVRVGNFVATSTAASTMQTALLIHLAEALVDYAQQLSQRVAATFEDDNSPQFRLFELQCKLLEEKATSRMRSLKQVKALFTKMGFMKHWLLGDGIIIIHVFSTCTKTSSYPMANSCRVIAY
ncbi:uncharacterized protein F4807DRAFT_428013 [Annulohypoxylon truncatum]|uniref:uncharacterized protein n=1 Tax=Annulohypoxylon truncatum TaxID=327061 RepID=UPI0020084379|nr:uncharacterized protein F4807DRAFT_428013 [Annulohypoxylon truncatum]KAI1209325.1 hypothetical protein F4807DRAFT_428013 [Annulohypoxylon truncatum]